MKVLLLTPEYQGSGGGIITFYRQLAPALRNAGVELNVIEGSAYHAEIDASPRIIDGVSVQTLERHRLEKWWGRYEKLSATPGLRRHLAAAWAMWEQADYGAGVDLVESCDWGLLFVPPAAESTRPLVVQCHGSVGQIAVHDPIAGEGTQSALVRLLERAVISVARNVQSYSLANASFWRGETGREVELIHPAWAPRVQHGGGAPSGRGLVVGRLQQWKGPHTVCEALCRLGERAPIVEWFGRDTAWGEKHGSAIAHLSREYRAVYGSKFIHCGQILPSEVAERQASALFNLVPSTWDVFNFTAIEAMASGRPTIVSTGAGASELVEDGFNGFLFSAGDAKALISVLDRVLNMSAAQMKEIGLRAQETVGKALDPQAIATRRVASYEAAIQDFSRNQPRAVDGWVGDICRPSPHTGKEMDFLENVPLRLLAKHVAIRTMRRFFSQ